MPMSTVPEPAAPPALPARAIRRRGLSAVGLALVPVVFTAAASATAQLTGADAVRTALLIAAGAGVSSVVGLLVMAASPDRVRDHGLRLPRRMPAIGTATIVITVAVAVGTQGVGVAPQLAAASALLAVAVAVDEEVWFRGIVLAVLRAIGVRTAVIGSATLFGILHLAQLASGQDGAASALQVAFAALFGLVAAELAVVTGSILPAVAWHAAWDLANSVGDAGSPMALAGIGVACAVMATAAVALWRPAVGGPPGSPART